MSYPYFQDQEGTPLSRNLYWFDVQIDDDEDDTLRLVNIDPVGQMYNWTVLEVMDAIQVAHDTMHAGTTLSLQRVHQKSATSSPDIENYYLIEQRGWNHAGFDLPPTAKASLLPNEQLFVYTTLASQSVTAEPSTKQTPVPKNVLEDTPTTTGPSVAPQAALTANTMPLRLNLVDEDPNVPFNQRNIWIELVMDLDTLPTLFDLKIAIQQNWSNYIFPEMLFNIQVNHFFAGEVLRYRLYPYVPTKTAGTLTPVLLKDIFPDLTGAGANFTIINGSYNTLKVSYSHLP